MKAEVSVRQCAAVRVRQLQATPPAQRALLARTFATVWARTFATTSRGLSERLSRTQNITPSSSLLLRLSCSHALLLSPSESQALGLPPQLQRAAASPGRAGPLLMSPRLSPELELLREGWSYQWGVVSSYSDMLTAVVCWQCQLGQASAQLPLA